MKKSFFILTFIFLLTFSTGFVYAENPLLNFFGGQSGLVVQNSDDNVQHVQNIDRSNHPFGGFFNFISKLFGFGNSEGGRPNFIGNRGPNPWMEHAREINSMTEAQGTADDLVFTENPGPNPTLTCLPNTVVKGEPLLMFWQCLDGSNTAHLSANDSTDSKIVDGIGYAEVNPLVSGKYKILCEGGTSLQCGVDVINPTIAITTSASSVKTWEKVLISWNTTDMKSCVLESDDNNSKYANWKRNGTQSSQGVYSHPITKTTEFTLTCSTETGLEKRKSVTITLK